MPVHAAPDPAAPAAPADATRAAPPSGLGMLLAFPAAVLTVTLAVVLVGAAERWSVLAAAMLVVAALTVVVSLMTARLLGDDRD